MAMGALDGMLVRDAKDCIREAAARGRGRDSMMLSSHQSCSAGRVAFTGAEPPSTQHPGIQQQFIHSSARSSHGGHAKVRKLMHRVLRVINALLDFAAGATHLHTYSTQHLRSYMPTVPSFPGWCEQFLSNSHLLWDWQGRGRDAPRWSLPWWPHQFAASRLAHAVPSVSE